MNYLDPSRQITQESLGAPPRQITHESLGVQLSRRINFFLPGVSTGGGVCPVRQYEQIMDKDTSQVKVAMDVGFEELTTDAVSKLHHLCSLVQVCS